MRKAAVFLGVFIILIAGYFTVPKPMLLKCLKVDSLCP